MSKSLGNFFTIRDIGKKYPLQVIRFFMLSAHYRSPLNFSDTLVESAKNSLERILTAMGRLEDAMKSAPDREANEAEKELLAKMEEYVTKYENAMEDDLNTADAISVIFEMVKLSNSSLSADSAKSVIEKVYETIGKLCDILGIITKVEAEILDSDIEALIEERQAARKAKNFARADEIRDTLAAQGIILEDTREGVKWKRA
jgi:cysteinyl-tRNA synthetase